MRKRAEESEELVRNMIVREKQNALPSGYRSTVSTVYSLTGTAPDVPQPPQPSPEDAFSFAAGFRTFPNHLYNMPDVPSSDRLAPPAKARKRETSEVARKVISGQAARRQIKTAIKGTKGPNPYLREMAKLANQSTSSPSSTSRSDAVPYDWQRARKEVGDLPLGNSNEGELPEEEDGEDKDEADEADEDDDDDEDEDDEDE